jgi:hypothetical protein
VLITTFNEKNKDKYESINIFGNDEVEKFPEVQQQPQEQFNG